MDQTRLKPCRGRPLGLYGELDRRVKREIPANIWTETRLLTNSRFDDDLHMQTESKIFSIKGDWALERRHFRERGNRCVSVWPCD